jgi:hypothetical protein
MKSQMGIESGGEEGSFGTHDGDVKTILDDVLSSGLSSGLAMRGGVVRRARDATKHTTYSVIQMLRRDRWPTVAAAEKPHFKASGSFHDGLG